MRRTLPIGAPAGHAVRRARLQGEEQFVPLEQSPAVDRHHLENLGSSGTVTDPGEDVLDTVPVHLLHVRHGIGGEHHVIAVLVGGAGRRLDTRAGGDTGEE